MTPLPNSRLVDSRSLLAWCTDLFGAAGMPPADARTAAEVLVRTSLRGVDTHGVSRAPLYAEIQKQIDERNEARRRRDFKKADEIRQRLASQGITIEDRPDGTSRWKRWLVPSSSR